MRIDLVQRLSTLYNFVKVYIVKTRLLRGKLFLLPWCHGSRGLEPGVAPANNWASSSVFLYGDGKVIRCIRRCYSFLSFFKKERKKGVSIFIEREPLISADS